MSTLTAEPKTKVPAPPEVVPTWTLNSTHRCDRCGPQAYVKVVFKRKMYLLLCNHHFKAYEPVMKLQKIIKEVVNESARLDTGNRHQGSEN